MAAYQIARRSPSAGRCRSGGLENISDSPDRLQHLLLEALVDLVAQPEDEHVDHVRARIERVVPDVRQNHRLRDDPPGVAHQILEQRKLSRAESDFTAVAGNAASDEVHYQIADEEAGRVCSAAGSPDERLNASEELREREWLREVVVAAALESFYPVVDGVLRAEDDDRRPDALVAEVLDEAQSVQLRQHQVDDRDVVRHRRRHMRAGLAIRRVIDRESPFLETLDEEVGDRQIVFDDEHSHRVTLTRFSITEARFEKGNQQTRIGIP